MLILLKRFKKILIVLSFPYTFLLFLLVAPTNSQILAPGDLTPVKEAVVIEGVTVASQFHTVYVYNYYPMTPFQGILASINQTLETSVLTTFEKDISWRDEFLSGQVSKLSSLQISIIQAYQLASKEDETIKIDYHFGGLILSYRPSRIKDLQIGDIIVSINGENFSDHDEASFTELSRLRETTLVLKRKHQDEYTHHTVSYKLEDDEPFLRYYPNYIIDHSAPRFELPGLESVIGGPSGGMIQTLSIYASLLKLNIEAVKIAGTGTIEIDGSIGRIGGIRQKIYTAIDRKVDIFFMPKSHETDIIGIKYPFILVSVTTIEEAVQALHEVVN